MAEHGDFPAGTVWLVGAGPGDPELLTRKAERLIRAADLAIYIGKTAAGEVATKLMAAGLSESTPVAVVENASLPGSRELVTRLDLLALAARTALSNGPATILVREAIRGFVECSRLMKDTRQGSALTRRTT